MNLIFDFNFLYYQLFKSAMFEMVEVAQGTVPRFLSP